MIYKEEEIIFGISLVTDKERNSPLYLSRQNINQKIPQSQQKVKVLLSD